ncbi:unnamed protein product [Dovyalis caffra]|uniref:DUF1308 domain-containing protein n=1 Tax=Dovyalis caffra TaxID=77055 RepID=A0AAV1RPL9_9ROSI|nr:unnamed protein product [Dovyalis caffra]
MEQVEAARKRCSRVIDTINKLPSQTNITESCKRTLLKLAKSELHFLSSRFTSTLHHKPLSVNIGHLEAVIHILQQPFITGVSRVCKPIPLSLPNRKNIESFPKNVVHVDIVCTLNKNPVWIIVSDRNPRYVSWFGDGKSSKGLKFRLEQVLVAAQSTQIMKPCSIVLFFSHGVSDFVYEKLREEFGACQLGLEFALFDFDLCEELEGGEWVNVVANSRSFQDACVFEIKVGGTRENAVLDSEYGVKESLTLNPTGPEVTEEVTKENLNDGFGSLISGMKLSWLKVKSVDVVGPGDFIGDDASDNFINFDTTALIAIVSGISNGCTEKLLDTPEDELRKRFKGNYEFVIAQVKSEIQNPILAELAGVIHGKRGITCGSVLSEFKQLVSLCGGPNERLRADKILKCLTVVPDRPSERLMAIPTTRKLALKNKVVFGTGDHWRAPTLTANMAFLRAVSQTGMPLPTIEHRPRALTGD